MSTGFFCFPYICLPRTSPVFHEFSDRITSGSGSASADPFGSLKLIWSAHVCLFESVAHNFPPPPRDVRTITKIILLPAFLEVWIKYWARYYKTYVLFLASHLPVVGPSLNLCSLLPFHKLLVCLDCKPLVARIASYYLIVQSLLNWALCLDESFWLLP